MVVYKVISKKIQYHLLQLFVCVFSLNLGQLFIFYSFDIFPVILFNVPQFELA